MTRNGQKTVIPANQPTAGASSTRAMGAGAPRTVLQPAAAARPATPAAARPNQGGTISTQVAPNVRATVLKPATPAANTAPNRPNAGGTMVRGGVTTVVSPGQATAGATATRSAPPAPVAAARPAAAPAVPNAAPAVPNSAAPVPNVAAPAPVTPPAPAAQQMGFSSRGTAAPTGNDAAPGDANVGGTGLYSKRFSSPASAKIYNDYVSRILGGSGPSAAPTI